MTPGSARRIVVFDIDGTLTATTDVDHRLFSAVVREVLGLPEEPDLFGFDEVTDSGIVQGLCDRHGIRSVAETAATVKSRFLRLLEHATTAEPQSFRPIKGARTVMERVRAAGWTPTLATGAWRESALTKLHAAGIDFRGVPLASSSYSPRRGAIIRHALHQAGGNPSVPAVYVGDGSWDIRAARQIGVGFLGRGDHQKAEKLRRQGATTVVRDYSDLTGFLESLESLAESGWTEAEE